MRSHVPTPARSTAPVRSRWQRSCACAEGRRKRQPTLTVGAADERPEREADRVAVLAAPCRARPAGTLPFLEARMGHESSTIRRAPRS